MVISSTLYLCGCENTPVSPPEIAEGIEAGSVVKVDPERASHLAIPERKNFGKVFSNFDDWEGMDATEEALLAMTDEEKRQLKTVGLRYKFTDKSMEAIQGLENIENLSLGNNPKMTEKGMLLIGTLSGLKSLVYFDFHRKEMQPGERASILTGQVFHEITTLNKIERFYIYGYYLTDESFQHLSTDSNLKSLVIFGNSPLTQKSLKGISKLKNLESLTFHNHNWNGEGLNYLVNNSSLKSLNLLQDDLDDDGLKHLKNLRQLSNLVLKETKITDQGLKLISHLSNLTSLHLDDTGITDAGMAVVSKLTNLEFLYLDDTAITRESLVHIKKLPKLKSLFTSGTVDNMIFKEYMKRRKESLETSE